jgi:hypothetical protein
MQLRGIVLVEGTSDRRAVETLARRRGRDLQAEGVAIVPMGGYGNLPRLLGQYRDVRLAGLYDVGEERQFLRALGCNDRGELERLGFYACTRDLEDELTRAVGPDGMERVLAEHGELRAFRTYQKQPAAPRPAARGTAARLHVEPQAEVRRALGGGTRPRARSAAARPRLDALLAAAPPPA